MTGGDSLLEGTDEKFSNFSTVCPSIHIDGLNCAGFSEYGSIRKRGNRSLTIKVKTKDRFDSFSKGKELL